MSGDWIETSCCRQRLRADGILEMRYRRGVDHTLADAKEEVAIGVKLVGEAAPVPCLVILGAVRNQEPAAREYLMKSEALAAVVRCTAFVASTPVTRVIATVFSRLRKSPTEVRVFGDEGAAIRWLGGDPES